MLVTLARVVPQRHPRGMVLRIRSSTLQPIAWLDELHRLKSVLSIQQTHSSPTLNIVHRYLHA